MTAVNQPTLSPCVREHDFVWHEQAVVRSKHGRIDINKFCLFWDKAIDAFIQTCRIGLSLVDSPVVVDVIEKGAVDLFLSDLLEVFLIGEKENV